MLSGILSFYKLVQVSVYRGKVQTAKPHQHPHICSSNECIYQHKYIKTFSL